MIMVRITVFRGETIVLIAVFVGEGFREKWNQASFSGAIMYILQKENKDFYATTQNWVFLPMADQNLSKWHPLRRIRYSPKQESIFLCLVESLRRFNWHAVQVIVSTQNSVHMKN